MLTDLSFLTDFGPKRITVNAIAPGGIKTDMYVEAARKYIPGEASMSDEQIDQVSGCWINYRHSGEILTSFMQAVASFSPLKRAGYPTDVSRVVAFLCSEDAGWMNGQVLTIGGGATM